MVGAYHAEQSFAPHPDRSMARLRNLSRPQSGFLTDDYLARWIDPTSFAATKAASVRLRTPNARKSAAVWNLLVPSASFNRRAMSLLDMPRDKSGRISFCLGVNLTVSNSPLAGGEIWLFPS